jgi:hypothetical protein
MNTKRLSKRNSSATGIAFPHRRTPQQALGCLGGKMLASIPLQAIHPRSVIKLDGRLEAESV